jgi:DNA-binding FadR family transcriptional regulator
MDDSEIVAAAIHAFARALDKRTRNHSPEQKFAVITTATDVLVYNVIMDLIDPDSRDEAMQALAAHLTNVGRRLMETLPGEAEVAKPPGVTLQ